MRKGDFADRLALIVGGSRGLGEVTAKIIARRQVFINWHSGRDDAEKVAKEIRTHGGTCETLAYDARLPSAPQLAWLSEAPNHAYYFATPQSFRPPAGLLFGRSPPGADCNLRGRILGVGAGAAGEALCMDMNTSMKQLHATVSRLPRVLTDQTASAVAAQMPSALETLLPIIRESQL